MQLSAVFVSLSVFLASVAAGPVSRSVSMNGGHQMKGAIGAAYFMSNEPSGNFVISADIQSNGELSLAYATSTSGIGIHGQVTGGNGPDGLFSQNCVKASAEAKMLAAVNPGSNTVSIFAINPSHPSELTMVGQPMSSGGEFPVSLAFNPKGTSLCVLNGGAVNGIKCFSVNAQTGLSGIANTVRSVGINQTTPATGPAGSASHVIFNEDGSQLIASIKGTPTDPGFLAVWDVAANGSLSQQFRAIAPPKGGALPFGMNLIPGMNAVLATDPASGFDVISLAANGTAASSANTVAGEGAVCWTSYSKKTGNYYLTDVTTSLVTEVSVDKNLKAKVVKQYQQTKLSGTIDTEVASTGSQDFLYVLGANATQVQVVSLEGPGQAKTVQTVPIASAAKKAGLKISSNMQGMTVFMK